MRRSANPCARFPVLDGPVLMGPKGDVVRLFTVPRAQRQKPKQRFGLAWVPPGSPRTAVACEYFESERQARVNCARLLQVECA